MTHGRRGSKLCIYIIIANLLRIRHSQCELDSDSHVNLHERVWQICTANLTRIWSAGARASFTGAN